MAKATTTMSPQGSIPELTVSAVEQEPFIMRDNRDQYTGFLVDLLNEIARRADFTFKIQPATDNKFGYARPGGWTGAIGDIIDGKADITGAALTVTAKREEVVDFTKPFFTDTVNLLVKKPTWTDLGLGYLVRPFSSDYWIMLLVVLLLIGIVFFIIGKFSPYEWGNVAADRDPRGAKNSFTLRNSYLFALSSLTWQGFREAPKSLSGRIMAAFWWIFVLFSLIAYTANLTAYFLSRPEQMPNLPFKTYEELLESPDIRIGAVNFGATQSRMYSSRSADIKALWTKMNAQDSFLEDYKSGVDMVKAADGKFVMFMEASSAEYYARRECNLMVYGENLFPSSMAFAVKKGSYWRNKINEAMKELQEDEVLQQLKDKYWRFGGACAKPDGRDLVEAGGFLSTLPIYPVTLKDMAVAILLLFLGFIAAMIFLVIEIVHYAVTKKGKKIEKPNVLKHTPKIFKLKKKPAKAGPEGEDVEAGPSSGDGLESVPLDDAEEPGASSSTPLREGEEKTA